VAEAPKSESGDASWYQRFKRLLGLPWQTLSNPRRATSIDICIGGCSAALDSSIDSNCARTTSLQTERQNEMPRLLRADLGERHHCSESSHSGQLPLLRAPARHWMPDNSNPRAPTGADAICSGGSLPRTWAPGSSYDSLWCPTRVRT
jgi:hypothetical protein